ncbi:MAG: LPP20 family lipoprotein [Pseudomonadota bacterium]
MKYIIIFSLFSLFLSACAPRPLIVMPRPADKIISAIGYSTLSSFKNYPLAQQKLLAIRGAKLDAYRSLAEELDGVRIKSNTTVKDMVIENDSYRAYVNTVIRGAHLVAITPKAEGVYEAEVSLTITPKITGCLYVHTTACSDGMLIKPMPSNKSQFIPNYADDNSFSFPKNFIAPLTGSSYDCQKNCPSTGVITPSVYYAY